MRAAETRPARETRVSGQARVFRPQSGLTHRRSAGTAVSARRSSRTVSTGDRTRGEWHTPGPTPADRLRELTAGSTARDRQDDTAEVTGEPEALVSFLVCLDPTPPRCSSTRRRGSASPLRDERRRDPTPPVTTAARRLYSESVRRSR
ncbi:hypothetical protein TR51_16820 [Kitasatospora griseola]|uniref:Uncharacterized protein n=1 Tax=Kitasatospora griseola TaxID=2064 RepID=A0A0D0P1M0_KITGR|nr:hypothetical protein TR51_16820 [Kitasatospora griseola]